MTVSRTLIGRTVGNLTVIGELPRAGKLRRWECLCLCGNKVVRLSGGLWQNRKYVAGCSACHAESTRQRSTTHGHAPRGKRPPEYEVWRAMRRRCRNEKCTDYQYYGARGIDICERWESFAVFFADMGQRPSPVHSIDRIDVDKNYSPENCRWADPVEQRRNQRRYIEVHGAVA